ncbi:MAG: translation initiation factor [Candidatus Saccharibacteria bacterium]|nr:translation initiation factor [Candidatus Saccharibacteria bacterium]
MATMIEVEDMITVGALAERLSLPVTQVITVLMKNGILATVNEKIDFDTAQIITGELGLEDIELVRKSSAVEEAPVRQKFVSTDPNAEARPPVVAVMGHVDHGKTSLLDAIRSANVVKGEAGGITQHISAYKIMHGDRGITFLDTPGHEAFAALREHGAMLTDLVIIVVAADDGIKPQTLEAIRFARKAGVKMLVAITKIDKPASDINRIKQQLSEAELMPEEWGGDTVILGVSAKTGEGLKELLDMVLLIADVEELKAVFKAPATGLIIESHMETGRGAVAEALVEQGTLKPGDFVVAGGTYAKVRNLESTTGGILKEATPSTPVVITGFKALPEFGDAFEVVKSEKEARAAASGEGASRKSGAGTLEMSSNELIRLINRSNQLQELNIIVKADVQGSLTSVIDSLKTLDNAEVAVRIVGSGVGAITENDMHMAHTSKAIIYGFDVTLPANVKQIASRDKVSVRMYKVIYELIDDVKAELTSMLAPEVIETPLGRLVVKGIFKTTKTEVICGGEVTKGKLTYPALARVMRDKEEIAEVEVTMLKRGPVEAKEVQEGEMCGMTFVSKARVDIAEGDHIEFFTRELKTRSL